MRNACIRTIFFVLIFQYFWMYQKPNVLETAGLSAPRSLGERITYLAVDVMAWDSPRYVLYKNENWNLSF